MTRITRVAAAILVFAQAGCTDSHDARDADIDTVSTTQTIHAPMPTRAWKLPRRLDEISGLAFANGDLLAHDDEVGVIYTIDYDNGQIVAEVSIASPTPRGDFEGIALGSQGVGLITSAGVMHPASGDPPKRVVPETCEIEGLTANRGQLHAVCKAVFNASDRLIRIHHLNGTDLTYAGATDVTAPWPVRPSAIAWDPLRSRYLVLTTKPARVIELTESFEFSHAIDLDPEKHRQPEGIEVLGSMVFIADEAGGNKARLTIYENSI